ncbi:MAG: LuxR C-terminal-related transcriptional regulator [Burkholderiales bacterium]|nr:LuxR C-terminal-related transcriptional regulator [Burkholderiales bacterium]
MALVSVGEGLYADAVSDLLRELTPGWLCVQRDVRDVDAPLPEAARVVLAIVERAMLGRDLARGVAALRRRFPKVVVLAIDRAEDASAERDGAHVAGAAVVPAWFGRAGVRSALQSLIAYAATLTDPRGRRALDPLHPTAGRDDPPPGFGLTDAEEQVLTLLARGHTNAEIAKRRGVAEGTVRIQVSAVLRKLGARNRFEATWIALRLPGVLQQLVSEALAGDTGLAALMPHVDQLELRAGDRLFARGDRADAMYRVQGGRLLLPEIDVAMRPGDWFGEIGLLSPDGRRTTSAVCTEDTQLFVLTAGKVRQMFYVSPEFALHVLDLVTRRLLADRDRHAMRFRGNDGRRQGPQ